MREDKIKEIEHDNKVMNERIGKALKKLLEKEGENKSD